MRGWSRQPALWMSRNEGYEEAERETEGQKCWWLKL